MGNMEKQLKVQQLVDNLAKAIVGKDEAIQLVLVALFSEVTPFSKMCLG
jgi:MoxR-like ATPase